MKEFIRRIIKDPMKDDRYLVSCAKIGTVLDTPPKTQVASNFRYWCMNINIYDEEVLKALRIYYCNNNHVIFPTKEDYELYRHWV